MKGVREPRSSAAAACALGLAMLVPVAPAWAYPPAVGILGPAKNCLSCHANKGPWKDDANLIIDILDKTSGRSLRQSDGSFVIAAAPGSALTVLTVIGVTQDTAGPLPYRNAWLYIDPRHIAEAAAPSTFPSAWDVNLPLSCRLVGDASPAYPGAHVTVLPMTVWVGHEARDAAVQLQVMLTRGESVKAKPKEGMVGSYFERTVHLKVLGTAGQTPSPSHPLSGSNGQGVVDFELAALDGGRFTLSSSLAAGPVLLWFTNFCSGCQAHFGEVNALAEKLAGQPVSLAAVSILGSDTGAARAATKKAPLEVLVLIDPGGEVSARFTGVRGSNVCPLRNLFILDRTGATVLASHFPGGVSVAEVEKTLRGLAAR